MAELSATSSPSPAEVRVKERPTRTGKWDSLVHMGQLHKIFFTLDICLFLPLVVKIELCYWEI